jgi:hypothetical protein
VSVWRSGSTVHLSQHSKRAENVVVYVSQTHPHTYTLLQGLCCGPEGSTARWVISRARRFYCSIMSHHHISTLYCSIVISPGSHHLITSLHRNTYFITPLFSLCVLLLSSLLSPSSRALFSHSFFTLLPLSSRSTRLRSFPLPHTSLAPSSDCSKVRGGFVEGKALHRGWQYWCNVVFVHVPHWHSCLSS